MTAKLRLLVAMPLAILSYWSLSIVAQHPPLPQKLIVVGDLDPWSKETDEVGWLVASRLEAEPSTRPVIVGDICNPRDRAGGTQECYDKLLETSWGPILPLAYAVPGNHDYDQVQGTSGVPVFFNQPFNAGGWGEGWQVFDWGSWGVMLLNSIAVEKVNGRMPELGKRELAWMERELEVQRERQCILAVFHYPKWSSGSYGTSNVDPLMRLAYKYGVDFYAAAHDHIFDALPPLAPLPLPRETGVIDLNHGIPGVIVGTGGAIPHSAGKAKWGEEVLVDIRGVVEISLTLDRFSWEFLPVPSQRHLRRSWPTGSGRCHGMPPGYVVPPFE